MWSGLKKVLNSGKDAQKCHVQAGRPGEDGSNRSGSGVRSKISAATSDTSCWLYQLLSLWRHQTLRFWFNVGLV